MAKEFKSRKDIPVEYTWDLESMYANEKAWEEDLNKVFKLSEEYSKYNGRVIESGENLLNAIKDMNELYRVVSKVYSYSSMNLDQDTRVGSSQEMSSKALAAYVKVNEETSFFVPEVLQIEETTLNKYYAEVEELKLYKQALDEILRKKDHVLSAKEESLLAQMGEMAEASHNIFSMLDNADIKFPIIKDEKGEDVQITHGNFIPFMESKDRNVRKAAFEGLYRTYKDFENTYAQALNGNTKKNIFFAKARNYNSSIEASLDENNVPVLVYDNLLNSIHDNLDSMHKYMDIRKRALGVDELHMYDLYTPIVKDVDINMPEPRPF